ncbi:uncharacterized protein MONBRDRAFT_30338, partial [Monosiga brevicollis MX1]
QTNSFNTHTHSLSLSLSHFLGEMLTQKLKKASSVMNDVTPIEVAVAEVEQLRLWLVAGTGLVLVLFGSIMTWIRVALALTALYYLRPLPGELSQARVKSDVTDLTMQHQETTMPMLQGRSFFRRALRVVARGLVSAGFSISSLKLHFVDCFIFHPCRTPICSSKSSDQEPVANSVSKQARESAKLSRSLPLSIQQSKKYVALPPRTARLSKDCIGTSSAAASFRVFRSGQEVPVSKRNCLLCTFNGHVCLAQLCPDVNDDCVV